MAKAIGVMCVLVVVFYAGYCLRGLKIAANSMPAAESSLNLGKASSPHTVQPSSDAHGGIRTRLPSPEPMTTDLLQKLHLAAAPNSQHVNDEAVAAIKNAESAVEERFDVRVSATRCAAGGCGVNLMFRDRAGYGVQHDSVVHVFKQWWPGPMVSSGAQDLPGGNVSTAILLATR